MKPGQRAGIVLPARQGYGDVAVVERRAVLAHRPNIAGIVTDAARALERALETAIEGEFENPDSRCRSGPG